MLRTAIGDQRITNLAAGLRPPLAQYRLLRSMLPRYRSLASDPAFPALPSITHAVHPGDHYADLGVLCRELIAFGDLPGGTPPAQNPGVFAGPSVDGVKHFQSRHGLEPDGVLGKDTVAALRVPPSWRVRQIELALERLRWLPHVGDRRLVALNIPMFRLWAWDAVPPSGAPLFGTDVIVGRALNRQTPVFVAEMGEVVCDGRTWRSCEARETTRRGSR